MTGAGQPGNQTWTYYATGKPQSVTTLNGTGGTVTNSYAFNRRGLLTSETQVHDINTWTLTYGYNANGHPTSLVYPAGLTVNQTVNALGQVTGVTGTTPFGTTTYASLASYHPNGALKQFTYGNGIVHTLWQNLRGLPDQSKDAYQTSVVALDDSYDYDGNGNVAAISDGRAGARGNRTMTYDGLDRLTATTSPMFGGTVATYAYDALDNLTRVVAPGRDHWYCYDGKWQLTNVKTGGCGGASVIGLGYDVQGNLSNKNGQGYAFDYGNRLRSATNVENYRYDAHGRRVWAEKPGVGKIFSLYANDGSLLWTRDERAGKRIQHVFLAGSLVAQRSRPIGTDVETLTYQHTDALGSPVAVTNISRGIVETSEFEPYGKLLNRPLADGPGYTGHVSDAATGLSYMQQRYYDPGLGRFLSVDPVSADSAGGSNFNRYWYANDNPYAFTDPDGRLACLDRFCDGPRKFGPTCELVCLQSGSGIPKAGEKQETRPEKSLSEQIVDFAKDAWETVTDKVLPAIPGEGPAAAAGGKFLASVPFLARISGPVFRTQKAATEAAKVLGFKKINETVHGGQAVYQKGKLFITRDLDGHNGGAWKVAGSVSDLGSKTTRAGTWNSNLTVRIGD